MNDLSRLYLESGSLAQTLLDLFPVGVLVLRPHWEAGGGADFVVLHVNEVVQQHFPEIGVVEGIRLSALHHSQALVLRAYCELVCAAAPTNAPLPSNTFAGVSGRVQLNARYNGELLVVSLSPTTYHAPVGQDSQLSGPADYAESAKHRRQLHELEESVAQRMKELQVTRAKVNGQRLRLERLVQQAPAAICILAGPEFVYELVNPRYQQLFAERELLGKSVRDALPELVGLEAYETLRHVYATGETHQELGICIPLPRFAGGPVTDRYFNYIQQARYDESGGIDGVVVFIFEVTEQVQAQQQAATLQAAALADAERFVQERETFYQVFEQTPAAICLLRGPEHRMAYHNQAYQNLFPGRQMVGLTVTEMQPDAVAQGFVALLDSVYRTGTTFVGEEMRLDIDQPEGPPREGYFNFTYQAYREQGDTVGISVFAYDVTEQVLARRQAERQRQLLLSLYNEAPVPIAVLDGPRYVYQLINPAYQRTFPGRNLLSRPILEALPELNDSPLPAILDQVYRTGETFSTQEMPLRMARYEDAPPEEIYGSFTCQARRNAHGQVDGLVFFAFDVTEQVTARRQAEQSEARFRRLAETTPMVVWEADAAGHTTYLSPSWEQFTTTANGQGLGWQEFVHPDDQASFMNAWLGAVSTGQPFESEMRLRVAATGQYRWHLDRAVPLRDTRGQVVQWVGAAIDVHELKRLQQTLLESEQYFRQMADHVPAMLWVTDPAGQCTYLNHQWYNYTGQAEAEALGIGWLSAVHPNDAEAAGTTFRGANANQAPFQLLYRLRRHDGQYRWAIDAALPRFNAAGEYEGFVGAVFDIHERQLAEQALQRLTQKLRNARNQAQSLNGELRATNEQLQVVNQNLERTNADLDTFIYTASHDLKAPITNIEGLVDALQHQLPSAVQATHDVAPLLGMMRDSVARFQRTLGHLTDLTQLQREHGHIATPLNLAEVVEDVRQDLLALIEDTRAQLKITVDDCPGVLLSPKNLRAIVYNLVSNALKYRHPDRIPQVQISCRPESEHALLTVQDNGLGLTVEQQEQLFTLFRRFHPQTEGTGIGLYTVKRIIENAGGRIQIHSEPGYGSTFLVYLPR